MMSDDVTTTSPVQKSKIFTFKHTPKAPTVHKAYIFVKGMRKNGRESCVWSRQVFARRSFLSFWFFSVALYLFPRTAVSLHSVLKIWTCLFV